MEPKTVTIKELGEFFLAPLGGVVLPPETEVYFWDEAAGCYTPVTQVFLGPKREVFIK